MEGGARKKRVSPAGSEPERKEKKKDEEEEEEEEGYYSGLVKKRKKVRSVAAIINAQLRKAKRQAKKKKIEDRSSRNLEEDFDPDASNIPSIPERTHSDSDSNGSLTREESAEGMGTEKGASYEDKSSSKWTRSKGSPPPSPSLPPADKWKLEAMESTAKLNAMKAKLKALEEEEDDESLEVLPASDPSSESLVETFTVFVKYEGRVQRISINKTETLEKVAMELGEKHSVNPTDIILQRNGRELPTFSTPQSLNFSSVQIIEMFLKSQLETKAGPGTQTGAKREDVISLKFQTQNRKRNAIIGVGKDESFRFIKAKVGEALEMGPGEISLILDGDRLGDEETPRSQDLEDEDCLDVLEA